MTSVILPGSPWSAPVEPSPLPAPTVPPEQLARVLQDNPEYAARLARFSTSSTPNWALGWIMLAAALALVWFLLKHRAAVADHARSTRLYRRLDPWVQAMRAWFALAPVTFIYIATWTVTTVIFQGTPESLAGVVNRFNSTNIVGLLHEPVRVLFTSAFIVADFGFFFIGYVIVYVLITARLEQRIGSARVVVVGAGAHVLGSLLTVATEVLGMNLGLVARSVVVTQDVGVSYVMVGTCGAYLFLVGPPWRRWFVAAMAVGVLLPLVVQHTIWNLGHFLATCAGVGLYLVVRRWGLRDRVTWRGLVAQRPPRELPTWPRAASGAPVGTGGQAS